MPKKITTTVEYFTSVFKNTTETKYAFFHRGFEERFGDISELQCFGIYPIIGISGNELLVDCPRDIEFDTFTLGTQTDILSEISDVAVAIAEQQVILAQFKSLISTGDE